MSTLTIMSLQDIIGVRPSAVYNALSYVIQNSNSTLSACAVPGTTIYFNQDGERELPARFVPGSTIDCRCLTFFANLFAGIFQQIVTVKTSSTNALLVKTVSTVNISIYSPGDLSNISIMNNQKTASKVTLLNLSDPATLNGIANISLKAIRSIVRQAQTSPVFDDPVSRQIIRIYADYLATVPEDGPPSSNPLQFLTIQTANMIVASAGNEYNLTISDSAWKKLNIATDQTILQEIQLENIVRGITFRFADSVFGSRLGSVMDSIVSTCPYKNMTTPVVANDQRAPTTTAASTATTRHLWIILLPIVGVVVLVLVVVLCVVL